MDTTRLEDYGEVLTMEETAKVLKIGRQAAYESVRRGQIPVLRLSARRLVVPKEQLRKLLAGEPTTA